MRAAVLRELGTVPEDADFDEPTGDEEGGVLVDVLVAGLNPVDVFIATGRMPMVKPDPPAVAGLEGIGTVSGEGRRVYFNGSAAPFGSFAERTAANAESLIEVPDGIEDATAVCFGIAGMAGWISLAWRAQLRAGETVLVLGASGVVGTIATQAARLLGAGRVIAAARDEEALERLYGLGADATVRIEEEGFADRIREAAPGGVDVIVDPLWGAPAIAALEAAGDYGRLIQIGNSASPEASLPASAFRNKHAAIIGYTNFLAPEDVKAEAFRSMCEHAAAGELSVEVEEYELGDIADAWERQQQAPHQKIAIRP